MDYRFQFRDKVRVNLTGEASQAKEQLAELLKHHPWLVVGKPEESNLEINVGSQIVVKAGKEVHETCILPEVNGSLAKTLQREGVAVTHPSAAASALAIALRPLDKAFTLVRAHAVTALPIEDGLPSLDALDNVIVSGNHISEELHYLLSHRVSSHTLRVPVHAGMLQLVSVGLLTKPTHDEIIACWEEFESNATPYQLHSTGNNPLKYCVDDAQPQPRTCQNQIVQVGSLRPSALFDYDFVVVSNSNCYGPVAGAIRNAELLVQAGLIFW